MISSIELETFTPKKSGPLAGFASYYLNEAIIIFNCPVFFKEGILSVGIPSTKVGFKYSPHIGFKTPAEATEFTDKALELLEAHYQEHGGRPE